MNPNLSNYLTVGTNVSGGPDPGDDVARLMNCSWYRDVYQIATIGDGNCFIHALLKAFYKPYQENPSGAWRRQFAKYIRRDLGIILNTPDPEYADSSTKYVHWETAGGGTLPSLMMQEIVNPGLIGDFGIDFSLTGLQYLLNSSRYLGNEIYSYISQVLDLDIYILQIRNNDLVINASTTTDLPRNYAVVIVGQTNHWETVGVRHPNNLLQTVFTHEDPFISAIRTVFTGGVLSSVPARIDVDNVFVKNYYEVFKVCVQQPTGKKYEKSPLAITSETTFGTTDPYILAIKRNQMLIDAQFGDPCSS